MFWWGTFFLCFSFFLVVPLNLLILTTLFSIAIQCVLARFLRWRNFFTITANEELERSSVAFSSKPFDVVDESNLNWLCKKFARLSFSPSKSAKSTFKTLLCLNSKSITVYFYRALFCLLKYSQIHVCYSNFYYKQSKKLNKARNYYLAIILLLVSKIFLNIFVCKTTERIPKALCRKCRCVVDSAYKWALLYVWLPEVKSMFAQIVIDCQTKNETVSCEYCIVKENCHLRLELKHKATVEAENSSSGLLVPLLLMRV